jgi:hypothetical protein
MKKRAITVLFASDVKSGFYLILGTARALAVTSTVRLHRSSSAGNVYVRFETPLALVGGLSRVATGRIARVINIHARGSAWIRAVASLLLAYPSLLAGHPESRGRERVQSARPRPIIGKGKLVRVMFVCSTVT